MSKIQVEATRDDGALLVTDGERSTVILDGRLVGYGSRASALSKGIPWVAVRDQTVPPELLPEIRRLFDQEY